MLRQLKEIIAKIAQIKPVIVNLTNPVTMDFMANSLLAIGAAPIMSEALEEAEDLLNIARALNINLGTLNHQFIERVRVFTKIANHLNKPVTLDPVGCGATVLRTSLSKEILVNAQIIRGNASEIMALMNIGYKFDNMTTHGVENTLITDKSLIKSTADFSNKMDKTIIISGATDTICYQNKINEFNFGTPLMAKVTGMGCTLSAVISAFSAVEENHFFASSLAVVYFTLCAEMAFSKYKTPATFKSAFIDYLYDPDWDFIQHKLIEAKLL